MSERYFYVISPKRNSYYYKIGITSNIKARHKQHKNYWKSHDKLNFIFVDTYVRKSWSCNNEIIIELEKYFKAFLKRHLILNMKEHFYIKEYDLIKVIDIVTKYLCEQKEFPSFELLEEVIYSNLNKLQ